MTLTILRNRLEQLKGQRQKVENSLSKDRIELKYKGKELRQHEEALAIVKEVGMKVQSQLQFHISDITSLAMEAVFEDPYELLMEFVERRNQTECDLWFVRDGEKVNPLNASGGGAVDVAAFALRIAAWSMTIPRTNNVIVMDEPMRFLSQDLQEKASLMIKEISQKLGIQFLIITHEEELTEYADKVFECKIKNGKSKIA